MGEKEKHRKPKFWNIVIFIFNIVISLITTILGYLKLPDNINNFKIILSIILIYVCSFLVVLLLYSIIYFIKLYLYTKRLEEEYDSLYKYNEQLKKNYNKLLEKNMFIPVFVDSIIKKLELSVSSPTIEEVNYIKKVINLLDLDKYIYNERKGENEKE